MNSGQPHVKDHHQVKLSLRVWLIPVIILLTLLLAIMSPFKGWWMIFLAVSLTGCFSFYTTYHLRKNLQIQREMRFGWAQVGDTLEERIIIRNSGNIPATWLQITDHTNIPGCQQAIGTSVGGQSQTTWRTKHTCTRRGLYRIGPTMIETSDLFGLFRIEIHNLANTNILITPPIVPLPHIEVASGGQTGDGRHKKGVLEQSVAVSTIREYQPQDPLHHIHWPLTAKHDTLTTRVFENTPTGNWWIIQDMHQKAQLEGGTNNALETGIILSASLVNKGIQSGKAVGFIANDRHHAWIPAKHTNDQMMTILRTLALCEPGDISLNDLLLRSKDSLRQPASLIIITSDITLSWWESLTWLKAKGMVPTILLIDPQINRKSDPIQTVLRTLQNSGFRCYKIPADMFEDQIEIKEKPLWEWRVFGTGHAVPVKKPKDPGWKRIS